jgi:tRNA threonylcarbamoyladenosine biosynthesis protein TsaE
MQSSLPDKKYQRTYALADLEKVAADLVRQIISPILLFRGEMGSGKTTLIKAMCAALGVHDEVSSPTFALVHEYQTDQEETIYHFDFYRLEEPEEALDMGVDEYFESGQICMVEWPEKISKFLPANFGLIKLNTTETGREVTFYPECNVKALSNYLIHE